MGCRRQYSYWILLASLHAVACSTHRRKQQRESSVVQPANDTVPAEIGLTSRRQERDSPAVEPANDTAPAEIGSTPRRSNSSLSPPVLPTNGTGGAACRHQGRANPQALLTTDAWALNVDDSQPAADQGWFEQLGDAFVSLLAGLFAVVLALPILWFNERWNAEVESLIAFAKSEVHAAEAKAACMDFCNCLVHIQGAEMRAIGRVADNQFNVGFDRGCIKLRTIVEVFQLVQTERRERRQKPGGGRETVTVYSYSEQWSSTWHDSISFAEVRHRGVNKKPVGLHLGVTVQQCRQVEYGDGYVLPDRMVDTCEGFRPAAEKLASTVSLHRSGWRFAKLDDGIFFHGRNKSSPAIGDARVQFEYIPDGPATVLALQVEKAYSPRSTFLPYRHYHRPYCGMGQDEQTKAKRAQAEMTPSEVQIESGCPDCLPCSCRRSTPATEIFHIFEGSLTLNECFQIIRADVAKTRWPARLFGWALIFLGLFAVFSPFHSVIAPLPWLGPPLIKLGSVMVLLMCFVATLLLATLITMMAYLFYHTRIAATYALGIVFIVAGTGVLINHLNAEVAVM